jgi:hypothetical protein
VRIERHYSANSAHDSVEPSNGAGLAAAEPVSDTRETSSAKSWRDVLSVHPAADLFPLMSEAELIALARLR